MHRLLLFTLLYCTCLISIVTADEHALFFNFEILHNQTSDIYESDTSLSFEKFDNVLVNMGVPVLRKVLACSPTSNCTDGEKVNSLTLLISTGTSVSWVSHENCTTCVWSEHRLSIGEMNNDAAHTIGESQFGCLFGSYSTQKFVIDQTVTLPNTVIGSALKSLYMSTTIKFDGILGLGNEIKDDRKLKKESMFPYILFTDSEMEKKIFMVSHTNPNEGKLFVGGIPGISNTSYSTCMQIKNNALSTSGSSCCGWGCRMEYILFGEEYDFYLAKRIDEYVIFDSLSYYDIIPYDYLSYFLENYFSATDNCEVLPVGKEDTVYMIRCEETTEFTMKANKRINLILNGWAYDLGGEKFTKRFLIVNSTVPDEGNWYYFRILFSKLASSGWRIGSSFFEKSIVGYDYSNNQVLLYSADRYNFTLYTNERYTEDRSVFVLIFSVTLIVLIMVIALLFYLFNAQKQRILKNYQALKLISE